MSQIQSVFLRQPKLDGADGEKSTGVVYNVIQAETLVELFFLKWVDVRHKHLLQRTKEHHLFIEQRKGCCVIS
jgi:hypothetical protein